MNERLFMIELKMELRGLPEETKNEIITDYETYFQEAKREGLTEKEIIQRLGGSGTALGQSVLEKMKPSKAENENHSSNVNKVLVTIGLIFFNLIIVLGPLIGLIGVAFSFIVMLGAFFISPALVLLNFVLRGGHLFELMVSFILFGSSILLYPLLKKGISELIRLLKAYLKWNKKVMRGGAV